MTCRQCIHYTASKLANYGYCRAAPDAVARANFFSDDSVCWLTPAKFSPVKK